MFRHIAAACAATVFLQSCATQPPVLTAADLLTAPYSQANGEAFDVDALIAAMPAWADIKHANAYFDAAAGAMVLDDVAVSFTAMPDVNIAMDAVTIWSPDIDMISDVLSGESDAVDYAPLFDRIAISGLRTEGLQWAGGAQSSGLEISKLVIDGMAARSYRLADNPSAPAFRELAAIAGSYAFDGAAYSDLAVTMNDNAGNAVALNIGEGFIRNYFGGRTDYESIRNFALKTKTADGIVREASADGNAFLNGENPYAKILSPRMRESVDAVFASPAAILAQAYGGGSSVQTVEFMEVSGIDFSEIYGWIAKWELPPITETDLLSFGAWKISNEQQSVDGRLIFSRERAEYDLSDFYWLVPARANLSEYGSFMDIGVALDQIAAQTGGAAELAEARAMMQAVGLEQIRYDTEIDWMWNGDNGDLAFASAASISDFADIEQGVELGGPSLARWDELVRAGGEEFPFNEMSIGAFNLSVADRSMVDKLIALAAEQSGQSVEELRTALPAMMRATGLGLAEINPRLPDYLESLARFVESGGALRIDAAPPQAVALDMLMATGETAPETLPDVLNLTVTHYPQ